MSRRHLLLVGLLVCFVALPAASASAAGFMTANPGNYTYRGGPEGSTITVSDEVRFGTDGLRFTDSGGLSAGDCTQIDSTSAWCDAGGGDEYANVIGGGGDDTIDASAVGSGHIVGLDGGPGADTLVGHDGDDFMLARDGNVDSVDCRGGASDGAEADADDLVTNCETVSRAAPRLQMTSSASANEGQAVEFTLTLNAPATQNFTVDYTVTNGTTADADFSPSGAPNGTVTFMAGDSQKTISVPTNDDGSQESSETFTVALSNVTPGSAATLSNSSGTGTILDNEGPPVVSIADAPHVPEGSDASFAVTLNNPSSSEVTVGYQVHSGNASTTDYTDPPMSGGTVTFTPGEVTHTVTIATVDDTADEADQETFSVSLTNPSGATINSSASSGVGTIDDNDPLPAVSIADTSATEGEDMTFTVTKTGATDRSVQVFLGSQDGTATSVNGFDYALQGVLVTFSPSETTKTFTVPTTDDAVDEEDETFTMSITSSTNSTIPAGGSAGIGTILDDDPPSVLSIAGDTVTEGGNVTFTVTRTGASEKTVSASYATSDGTAHAPDDYSGTSGTVSFAPGESTKTFTVATSDDSVDEDDKTITATLSSPGNATFIPSDGSGTGTIADDDASPVLSITGESVVEGGPVTFTVTKSGGPTERTATVDYATSDGTAHQPGDYTSKTGTLTFAPGDTSKTFTVATADDSVDEDAEAVTATLSAPANATISTATDTGTITDNDDPPVLSISGDTATEGDPVTFTVTKTGATERSVTVDYGTLDGSASSPADYVAGTGTVSFAPGETSKVVRVATAEDGADEPDKEFSLVLDNPVRATILHGKATATIRDDDDPASPPSPPAPAPDVVRVTPTVVFSVAPARDRRAPFRYLLRGRVQPPAGTAATACRTNALVTARVTRRPKTKLVTTKRAKLSDTCTFRLRLSFKKRPGNGRLRATVAYAGNDLLTAAKSKSRSLRAG